MLASHSPLIVMESEDGASASRPTRRTIVAVTVGFWAFNCLLSIVSNRLDGLDDWQTRAAARVLASLVGLIFCAAIHWILERCRRWAFWRRAGLMLLLVLIASDALSWTHALAQVSVGMPWPETMKPGAIILSVAFWAWFLLAWASLYLAISYNGEARERERRWAALHGLAQAAQLKALRYQIRPHFLFNSLNSLTSLVLDSQRDEAVTMIRRLSEYLRRSLDLDPVEDIPLGQEVDLQISYLAIEKVRFPDLDVLVDVGPEVRDALVPAFVLQPLVENAVKFSVASSIRTPTIAIRARAQGDMIDIQVEDTGGGQAAGKEGHGIGLRNVQDRLRERYGDRHWFFAGPKSPTGFLVQLGIPLEQPK